MYKIIYMKADYEPWWKFEGWESTIVTENEYETKEEMDHALNNLLKEFRTRYDKEESREGKYYAFWTMDERMYCEACEDDIQIYHGIIVER
ncbi:hypothetical protein SAMN05880501_11631 [Ureibacillus xyleni]|uniref:DUF1033 family protein n=1 Tax=Ureibacillus xyleni TaxID=614648 RepID=A0A285TN27_9BACL|nr:DUF1033 family protein [Ureibacillus xyleni]SOC23885.1 hypothetical protein SAMN05880501_11631 [Ureibacillus xyleni]